MRFTFALLLSLVFSGLVTGTEYYSDVYNDIDVDAIIKSDRLLNQYVNCVLDRGPCTVDGHSLKRILPDAIATSCEKCNERQKHSARKVINHLKQHKPNVWAEIIGMCDPNKEHIASFERFMTG